PAQVDVDIAERPPGLCRTLSDTTDIEIDPRLGGSVRDQYAVRQLAGEPADLLALGGDVDRDRGAWRREFQFAIRYRNDFSISRHRLAAPQPPHHRDRLAQRRDRQRLLNAEFTKSRAAEPKSEHRPAARKLVERRDRCRGDRRVPRIRI